MSGLVAQALSIRLGPRLALQEVDLSIAPGRFTIVVGPNGAGKTTLLRALAGLLPPSSGSVTLDGQPVCRLPSRERAQSIAYLAQNGTIAWPMPVTGIVALGRLPHGETPDALSEDGRAAVAGALADVGLDGFAHRPATELSGGERARVLLARALATKAPYLLADEPVASLDPRHELVVLNVLRAHARAGATVVAIMHNLTLAARFANTIVLLREGRLVAHGPPAEVLTEARLAASFGIVAHIAQEESGLVVVAERPLAASDPV